MEAEVPVPEIRVLLVEDDEDDYRFTRELLAEIPGYRVDLDWAPSYEAGLTALARHEHDVCLLDYRLGKQNGLELVRCAVAEGSKAPIILLTGQGAWEVDLEAMRAGAADYLVKGQIDAALLERSIRYALERQRDRDALRELNDVLERRVEERTATLNQANTALQAEVARSQRAEEALRESGERLRLAMATGRMGYHYRDFAQGVAIYSNELGPLCGLPSGSSYPTYEDFLNAIHPDDRERVAQTIARVADEDTDYLEEFRIVWPDGTVRWLADRGKVYRDGSGQPLYGIGLAWDITERKWAEAERETLLVREHEARAEAEAADRAKDEFLAVVSHELRTPLNAMLSWVYVLETAPQPDAAMLVKATAVLKRSIDQQRQLIEDLLDTARVTSGKLNLEIQPLDLVPVVEAALEVVRPAAEARRVKLYTLIGANVEQIMGDAARLQQILWNLLSNAIKFTPAGGRIQLRLERLDPHVRITVSDTGVGIAPEFLPLVFERFRQADSSSSRRHGGLGLGLALVRHLVELHGGTVSVASRGEGLGTTFTVDLPVRAVRFPTPPTQAASAQGSEIRDAAAQAGAETPSLAGVRVLVMDDQDEVREALATVLARHGAQVTAVGSVREALALLASSLDTEPPHVLVCDIGMPEEDGYTMIRKLRALETDRGVPLSAQIPAIALTAYAQLKDRMRTLRAGFQIHLAKPVDPAELLLVIATLAQGEVKQHQG